jgi:hypothetical protein
MFDKKSCQLLLAFAKNNCPIIEVNPGLCRMNFRCHLNAVHDAIEAGHDQVAVVIYIDGGVRPVLHFINYDGTSYTDNNIGHWCKQMQYYLYGYVNKKDFHLVVGIISGTRNDILKKVLPWYIRIFKNKLF